MICRENDPLEMCPKALNSVGVDVIGTDVFPLGMINEQVLIAVLG